MSILLALSSYFISTLTVEVLRSWYNICMSATWENVLHTWNKPPSESEKQKRIRTRRQIENALKSYLSLDAGLYKVYSKGSVRNNTHVRLDSDVDIAVEYLNYFKYEKVGNAAFLANESLKISPSYDSYAPQQFRKDIYNALVKEFGASNVIKGDKSLKIRNGSTTLPADVVPCVSYRQYFGASDFGTPFYHEGTRIYGENGSITTNFPKQHLDNGIAKNKVTEGRYKHIVRILKRLENQLHKEGHIKNEIPSFLTESIVWNMPKSCFNNATLYEDLRMVIGLAWVYTTTPQNYPTMWEVNNIKLLFSNEQNWNIAQANNFLNNAWGYMGYKV